MDNEIFLDDYKINGGMIIAILSNGKEVSIDKTIIDKWVEKSHMKEIDAIEMWLCDNNKLSSDEQEELQESASKVKIPRGAKEKTSKTTKTRTVHTSDTKKKLFAELLENLQACYQKEVVVAKPDKLILVRIDGKIYKIDLVETTKKTREKMQQEFEQAREKQKE
jgi:hypothetical protein